MEAIAAYKYLGAAGVGVLAAGLAFILVRWPQGPHLTFSQHVATYRRAVLYYIALFSVVLPMLMLFFMGWFMPTFHLPAAFGFFVAAAALTQYACTLVPEIDGWRTRYHRLLAGISAICLVPPLGLLAIAHSASHADKLIAGGGLAAMVIIIGIVVMRRGAQRFFLLLQIAYFAAFFLPILFASYAH